MKKHQIINMYDLLLYNARVLNLDNYDVKYNTIAINNSNIVLLEYLDQNNTDYINNIENLKSNSKKSIDLKNQWITPGLVDCHTHLVFAGDRANEFADRIAGISYEEITNRGGGINNTVTATRKADFKKLLDLSINRIDQMIYNGVTSLEIKSGYGLDLESEYKILEVINYLADKYKDKLDIQRTFLGAHIVPVEYKNKKLEYINYLAKIVLPKLVENNLIDAVDGFCENIAFNSQDLDILYKKAKEYNLLIKGHTEQLSNIGGGKLVCNYNGISCDHLEYADLDLVQQMANNVKNHNNITAVLLPGAYYYINETTKPPIDLFREYKIPIAIATDFNPGTSPVISILNIMNMACVLYKITTQEAWQAVTINAAKALKLDHKLGSIELNKQADLIIWDFNHPDDVCYYMGMQWNKIIIKKGKIVCSQENILDSEIQ